MNNTEKDIDLNVDTQSEDLARNDQSKSECKNGVCELNWQPKRPQAA
ncbi:MAG: hypothetical protein SGJ27_24165 [Candidatus Melainabacteria bacterium]|nr:hypothetical protein [Candidatus Melainabacteria bacterium]